jgi:GMP synthase-like glutamine amidotransferase
MKIGLLQTGHSPDEMKTDLGDYDDLFRRLLAGHGLEFETWRVVDGEFPPSVHAAHGWLITGSRHGVYEDHAWIPPLESHIRDAHTAGVPVVGICFGHQIIAQAMGGRVEKFAGGWSVGWHEYDWGGEMVRMNAWHQDQVVEKPEGATVLASNPTCAYAALAYGTRAFSVQTHPEFTSAEIDYLLRLRAPGVVPDDKIARATANLDKPLDNARLAARIADFFKEAHRG